MRPDSDRPGLRQVLAGLAWPSLPEPADGRALMTPEEQDAARAAAVLIAIVAGPDEAAVLLTRRTDHLQHHAGQVSFPGGGTDSEDADEVATALREAREEIGLDPATVEVLGVLPAFYIPTGFRVTPVLGWLPQLPRLRADPDEVAEIFLLPVRLALDPAAWRRERIERAGVVRTVWVMDFEGRRIWGATAGILLWLAQALPSSP